MRFVPRLFALLVLIVAVAALPGVSHAQSFYEVDVTAMAGESDAALRERALAEMLIKASGAVGLASEPDIGAALAEAPNLIRSALPGTAADGSPTLRVSFDADGVRALLSVLGRPVWENRPKTVVWLVIDDGTQKRVANAGQAAALGPLFERARRRGVPLALPEFDQVDRGLIDAEVLWIGAPELIARASQRYAEVALVIRLTRSAAGWTARYTLIDSGEVDDWNGSFSDANGALAAGVDGATGRLARRYAVAAEDLVPGVFRVWIAGLGSAGDFARAKAALAALPETQSVRVEGAIEGRLLVTIDARVRLQRVLAQQTRAVRLVDVPDADTAGADAVFALAR